MKTRPLILGTALGLTVLSQSGCVALGLSTLGLASQPTGKVDTSALPPDGPIGGAPAEPGNGSVALTVHLPNGYQTQYVASEITRLVIGLVDLDGASTAYLGYEGTTKVSLASNNIPTYHATLAGTTAGGSHTEGLFAFAGIPGLTLNNTEKVNADRYLYYSVTAGITTAPRTVTFTNVKPGASRYAAFAAAFAGSAVAGYTQSAPFTTTGNNAGNQANTAPALTLTLNRGLGTVSGTTTIVEAAPAAN